MRPIVNINEIELAPLPTGIAPTGEARERYEPRVGMVGALVGARNLGCNLIALPPGKRAFPFHNHRANEEMFVVLEGTGEVRIGDRCYPLRAGDVISCPAGGPERAHQIINTSSAELRYLAISTKHTPDIIEYPDSGKFRVIEERRTDNDGGPPAFDAIHQSGTDVGYWDGE